MVDAVRGAAPEATLATYLEASGALCATVEALDEAEWVATAETPVGDVAVSTLVHHALWDSWVHERDVLGPLGMTQELEPDEILASLRYAAALAPAFALQADPTRRGSILFEITDPDARVAVTIGGSVYVEDGEALEGALAMRGDAVEVLEALSIRTPWTQAAPADQAWLLTGLADVFESEP
jgi:hypothetical protein